MSTRLTQGIFSLLLAALLNACGGGGGGGTPPSTIGVFTGFNGDLDWQISGGDGPGSGGDGDGGAGAGGDLGQFRGALVVAKFPDGSLVGNGSALTDSQGLVTIKPGKTYSGPLLVEIHGQPDAVYFDEGKNTFIPFPPGQILRVYVPTVNGNIGITPFTEAAYRLLMEGDTADRVAGVPTSAQVANANSKVLDIVNQHFPTSVQVSDITRLPITKSDTTQAGALGVDARGAYGLVNGAFSKQAAMFNPRNPAPTLSAIKQLSEDLLDGHLDGMRSGQSSIAADKRTYDPHTLAGELSSALAHQSYRYGKASAIDAMPAITNFSNVRYETYLFDGKLTPAGEAVVTVAGWDGANDKNRQTGEARPILPTATRIQSVHGNFGHGSMFVKSDSDDSTSKVYALGDNTNGELGDGTRNATTAAVEVTLPAPMTHVAGGFSHTVARLADGSVYTWGDNSYGQLGLGLTSAQLVRSETPRRVTLPRGALAVAASNVASYALLEDGTVYSWGSAWGLGLLGDGSKDNVRLLPGPVSSTAGPLSGVVQISARDNDAVVLRSDGSVMTWGSFPADQAGGFTGGRQVATAVAGLPALTSTRIRKVLTEQGLFVAHTTNGAVYHWGLHFDITAGQILRDVTAVQVLNLPPLRDIMPGGFLGYGERPFDRLTAMGAGPNGSFWKIRGRVAELFDPADPTAQRRPTAQTPRTDCAACHGVLPTWPIKAPAPTSNAVCVQPAFKLDSQGRPLLVNASTECTMCHNGTFKPFLNCVVSPPLPAAARPSVPPTTTTACQIPTAHVATPSGTVCATCHNSIIAQPLNCLPNTASDPNAPTTRAAIVSISDNVAPVIGNVSSGAVTNDTTPTLNGSLSAALVSGQTVQVLRNGALVGAGTVSGTTWTYVESGLAQGTYNYTARIIQGAALGPLGSSHTITIDTTAPSATITSATWIDGAGPVQGPIAEGATTDDSAPRLQGTLSAALTAGESIRILSNSVDVGGASVTGTAFSFASAVLSNGSYALIARVTDSAGNTGSSATRNLIVNTGANLDPAASAVISSFDDNVGSITNTNAASGTVTDDPTPTLKGTIGRALKTGEQLLVYRAAAAGGGGAVSNAATVTGTTWSVTMPSLSNGTYSFTAQIVATNPIGPVSAAFQITVDTTAPTGTVSALSANSDSLPSAALAATLLSGIDRPVPRIGAVANNSVTNDNTPLIQITLASPKLADETISVSRTVNGTTSSPYSPTVSGSGTSFSFTDTDLSAIFAASVATPAFVSGTFTSPPLPVLFNATSVVYTVRLADAAGNVGATRTLAITLDYPTCSRTLSGNHSAGQATCGGSSSCHQSGRQTGPVLGPVMVAAPGGVSAAVTRYWCKQ